MGREKGDTEMDKMTLDRNKQKNLVKERKKIVIPKK